MPMHQIFYQFDFELPSQDETDKLIALLAEQGFDGFVEEEDQLTAFIPELRFDQEAFEEVLEKFSIVTYTRSDIENINWNQQWEANFEPVYVEDFAGIRADFHPPLSGVAHEIVITPKMSFGTGHHATTWLVMKEMQSVDFTGKTVLDFGTGTGILAILAEQLGAASVLAIDNDEWSITNAEENLLRNHCERVSLEKMETLPTGNQYDIVLANINLNVIVQHLPVLAAVTHPGSVVIFSGILHTDLAELQEACAKAGFRERHHARRGDWIMLSVSRL